MADTPNPMRDQIVLLLVNGLSAEAAEGYVTSKGVRPEDAKKVVSEARKRITVAADYTRVEQIGRAVMRLDDLYAKSIAGKDLRTALQAQREVNRLLDLYAGSARAEATSDEEIANIKQQLELVAGYLLPLKVTDEQYPIEEHARVAAELIRTNGLAGV
jgi:hypothetical protein